VKIIALYLPQYHEIKENNDWWGSGYTEWSAVKDARSLFRGHIQPKIPLNSNYYDLSDESAKTWIWQAQIASQFGVYGFCIYHYWFETGKQLLEKPMEILLLHPEIDLKYFVSWANDSWTRTWYGLNTEVLMEQKYGESKEWENHFLYLLKFFKDHRYIKIDNKPIIAIYHSSEIDQLDLMVTLWDSMAKQAGFRGIYIISGNTGATIDSRSRPIDAYYNFEPGYTLGHKYNIVEKQLCLFKTRGKMIYNRLFKKSKIQTVINIKSIYQHMDYNLSQFSKKVYLGTFPSWDNTPRRSYQGSYYKNSTPQLFGKTLENINKKVDNGDYVFINAWNEWGEGCYLEPDNSSKYEYLDELSKYKTNDT